MNRSNITITSVLMLMLTSFDCYSAELPEQIVMAIPAEYQVLTFASNDFNRDHLVDYLVVLNEKKEEEIVAQGDTAPRRPLLVFLQTANHQFKLTARNNAVVYAADEGGQCDPFLDSGDGLSVKGEFFTVENSVACGQHWSDYFTFKYSKSVNNFIFHKRIFESWMLNDSEDPEADALKLQTHKVTSADPKKQVLFSDFEKSE